MAQGPRVQGCGVDLLDGCHCAVPLLPVPHIMRSSAAVCHRRWNLIINGQCSYNIRMNKPLKITRIGNSAGIVLPKDLLAHLDAAIGQELSVVVTPRGIELSAAEPDFDKQMAAAREVMARRKRALRELAK